MRQSPGFINLRDEFCYRCIALVINWNNITKHILHFLYGMKRNKQYKNISQYIACQVAWK